MQSAEKRALPKRFAVKFVAIAVGTAIADRPPHRSVLAELPHTAPTVDVDVRNGLPDRDGGYAEWGASYSKFL